MEYQVIVHWELYEAFSLGVEDTGDGSVKEKR